MQTCSFCPRPIEAVYTAFRPQGTEIGPSGGHCLCGLQTPRPTAGPPSGMEAIRKNPLTLGAFRAIICQGMRLRRPERQVWK